MYLPHWPKTFEPILKQRMYPVYYDVLKILKRLGNPHYKIRNPIYVAGTNGKGSTVSYISSILLCSGFNVNSCFSPHVLQCNERIVLNGEMISDDYLYKNLEKCRIVAESEGIVLGLPSAMTIAALLAFSDSDADFNIIEGTIGGRYDPMNVCSNMISVFTAIDVDHVEYLGCTPAKNAFDKSFIMRDSAACVIGKQRREEVGRLLRVLAADLYECSIYQCPWEWSCESVNDEFMEFSLLDSKIRCSKPSLAGDHQIENAGNSIMAIYCTSMITGAKITRDSIDLGIKSAKLNSRLQKINDYQILSLFPKETDLFIDGAHNKSGFEILKEWAKKYYSNADVHVIFGATKGKDIVSMYNEINAFATSCWCINVLGESRAMTSNDLYSTCLKINLTNTTLEKVSTLSDAMELLARKLHELSSGKKQVVLICGSLFLGRDLHHFIEGVRCVMS